MKWTRLLFLSFVLLLVHCDKLKVELLFEYPYSCGTWFNRGKNTVNNIKEAIEKSGIGVSPIVKSFHMGEFPQGYNGEFNIYLVKPSGDKRLVVTSDKQSAYFHEGLKYFAYTFYTVNVKNGERNYLEEFPQKHELLKYVISRMPQVLKETNLR